MSLTVPDFSSLKVLTVGDLMLDEYWFGPTERISPEAPVPVVNISGAEARAGGAANVASNLAQLGAQASVIGIAGNDANRDRLAALLDEQGIDAELVESADRPTITKLRVLSRNQQLIRLDKEDGCDLDDAEGLLPVIEQRAIS